MFTINPSTIKNLVALKDSGAPVTLTSHPGNASLYKLTLWQCGIPEHLWDITCCKADANNWPMYRLSGGKTEFLLEDELGKRIIRETNPEMRFVTAYQTTHTGERLGRVHVRPMQECFPQVISSQSRLLLSEIDKVTEMFGYLIETRSDIAFPRFITPDGVMLPIRESGIKPPDMVESFVRVLRELDHLLFSDEPITTRGGACYDVIMAAISVMLVQYWQTDRIDRYDISGPDMIHYSTRPGYQQKVWEVLAHLRRWNPKLVPEHIIVHMFDGTVARVGHAPGHVSEEVMGRKVYALQNQGQISGDVKKLLIDRAKRDGDLWPTRIDPKAEPYFSQHDLVMVGGKLAVDDFWKDIPIGSIWDTLSRANSMLRLR